jgi:hypothetical protein
MTRPFRFIAGLRHVVDGATLVEHARNAETVGYEQLCIHDHLTPQLGPIPMLTAAAMATTRLRVGPGQQRNGFIERAARPGEREVRLRLGGGRNGREDRWVVVDDTDADRARHRRPA